MSFRDWILIIKIIYNIRHINVYIYLIKMSNMKINLAIIFTVVAELLDIFDFQSSVEIYIYY